MGMIDNRNRKAELKKPIQPHRGLFCKKGERLSRGVQRSTLQKPGPVKDTGRKEGMGGKHQKQRTMETVNDYPDAEAANSFGSDH